MLKNTLSLLFLVFSVSAFANSPADPCHQKDIKNVMERYKWSNGFADQDAASYTAWSPMNMGLIRDGRLHDDGDMVFFFHKKEHKFYLYVYEDEGMWNGFVNTLNLRKAMLSTFPIVLINRSEPLSQALKENGWKVESCESPV